MRHWKHFPKSCFSGFYCPMSRGEQSQRHSFNLCCFAAQHFDLTTIFAFLLSCPRRKCTHLEGDKLSGQWRCYALFLRESFLLLGQDFRVCRLKTWISVSVLVVISAVVLDVTLKPSKFHLPHLWNDDNNSFLTLWEAAEKIYAKHQWSKSPLT